MPVIIWKEAALADYIIRNGCGFHIIHCQPVNPIDMSCFTNAYSRSCIQKMGILKSCGILFQK